MNPNDRTGTPPVSTPLTDDAYLHPETEEWAEALAGHLPDSTHPDLVGADGKQLVRTLVAGYGLTPRSSLGAVARSMVELIEWSPTVDPTDLDRLLSADNIALYARTASAHHAGSVVERRAGLLRRVSRNLGVMEPAAPAYSNKRRVADPYSTPEIAGYLRLFDAHLRPVVRHRMRLLVAVCAGAGADVADLRHLRLSHFTAGDGLVDVDLHGKKTVRRVPVAAMYAPVAVEAVDGLARLGGADLVFDGPRSKDFLQPHMTRVDWADKERLSARRLRGTWIVDRLTDGCRVDVIKDLLGDKTYSAITKRTHQMPEPSPADIEAFRGTGR